MDKDKRKEKESEKSKHHLPFIKPLIISLALISLIVLLVFLLRFYFLNYFNGYIAINNEEVNEIISSFTYEDKSYLDFKISGSTSYSLEIDENNKSLKEIKDNNGSITKTDINLETGEIYINDIKRGESITEASELYYSIKIDTFNNYLRYDSNLKDNLTPYNFYYYKENKTLRVENSSYYLIYDEYGYLKEGKIDLNGIISLSASYIK